MQQVALKKILEAAPYKAAVVKPLSSYLSKHPSNSNMTYASIVKSEQAHKQRSLIDTYTMTCQCPNDH